MTEQEHQSLIARGYKKCLSNNACWPYSDFFYQKCFEDSIGKKYYVDLVHYDNTPHINKWNTSPGFWMCHINLNEPHQTYEQHHVKLENLDILEKNCNTFWELFSGIYYEEFEK